MKRRYLAVTAPNKYLIELFKKKHLGSWKKDSE
jgi:hypothetical protein